MKTEEAKIREVAKERNRAIRLLENRLELAKRTIIAFADSHQGGSAGHKSWCEALRLYHECEKEIGL